MKISIIIPVYNAEKYMHACFDSIVRQTFQDYEVICVNDGSTDNSQHIIDEYVEKFPDKFKSYVQENQGQSAARNHGVDYATGKYIAYIDADDYILDDYFETLYNTAETKKSDLVICSYKKFLNDGTIVLVRNSQDWQISFGKCEHVFMYSPCAKLFRREMLVNYKIKFSEGEKMEDAPYGITTNCCARNVVVLDYFGYMYRMYDESTMGAVRKGGISTKKKSLRFPMKGLENAIRTVRHARMGENEFNEVLEYVVLKALAGFVFVFSKNGDKENLREICDFTCKIIKQYFPNMNKNRFIHLNSPTGLPFTHRAAVVMLKIMYNLHILYPFALVYTGVYKKEHI